MSLWKYLGPIGAIGTAITGNQAKLCGVLLSLSVANASAFVLPIAPLDVVQQATRLAHPAGRTLASVIIPIGIGSRVLMSLRTVSLNGVDRHRCHTTERVDSMSHELQVSGIHTESIPAEMIDVEIRRNAAVRKRVGDAVRVPLVPRPAEPPITLAGDIVLPYPAAGPSFYAGPEGLDVRCIERRKSSARAGQLL